MHSMIDNCILCGKEISKDLKCACINITGNYQVEYGTDVPVSFLSADRFYGKQITLKEGVCEISDFPIP